MGDLLRALRTFDALRDGEAGGDIVNRRFLDSIAPAYADDSVIKRLETRLRTALDKRGMKRLYRHQADAIAQALEGANVVLQAPTASGKTLAFQIPVLESGYKKNKRPKRDGCEVGIVGWSER